MILSISNYQVAETRREIVCHLAKLCLLGVASGLLAGVAGKGVAAAVGFFAGGRRDLRLLRFTEAFAVAAADGGGGCLCRPFATPSGLLPAAAAGVETVVAFDWR